MGLTGGIRLEREALATLEAATLKDVATGLRRVSFHKAVLDFALALVGLISAFGHKYKSYIVYKLANIWCYYSAVFHQNQEVFHTQTG